MSENSHLKSSSLMPLFRDCNREYFNGELNESLLGSIQWVEMSTGFEHGYCFKSQVSKKIHIEVSNSFSGRGMVYELRKLITHELIHFWQFQKSWQFADRSYLDVYDGGHGYYFNLQARRINAIERELDISGTFSQWSSLAVLNKPIQGFLVDFKLNQGEIHTCGYKSFSSPDVPVCISSIVAKYGRNLVSVSHFKTRSPEPLSYIPLDSLSRISV